MDTAFYYCSDLLGMSAVRAFVTAMQDALSPHRLKLYFHPNMPGLLALKLVV